MTDEDIDVWRARELQQKAYMKANGARKVWWRLVGMPPAEELAERLEGGPFTDAEEARIREIAREETGR